MRSLATDPVTYDLLRSSGRFQIATDQDAIVQRVSETLTFIFGEWFLDNTKGIPYYQFILVKNPNLDVVSSLLQNAILGVNGVTQLLSFNMTYDKTHRKISITWSAKSTNGTVIGATNSVAAGGTA